jgi:hypothetical protein
MPYTEPKSFKECANRLLDLSNRLFAIKQLHKYSDEDARGVALENCRLVCISNLMVLNILIAGEEGRIDEGSFKALTGFSGTAQQGADLLEKMQRVGFMVIFQFQIENLFSNLLREIKSSAPTGFYNIAKQILKLLPDSENKLATLLISSNIRNSLHSNGIHHGHLGGSFHFTIDDYTFEFHHMQKVNCSSWGHIILAFGAMVSIVEEILSTPVIQSLHDPIMDHYAWEEATNPLREST